MKFDLDMTKLLKGTWLRAPEIEEATGVSPKKPSSFKVAALRLRDEIEQHTGILSFLDGEGAEMALRLMDDAEASKWLIHRGNLHEEGLQRCVRRGALVDRSQLSDKQRAIHDHGSRKMQAIAAAARAERMKFDRLNSLVANNTRCQVCGLRGEHECLAGTGQTRRDSPLGVD